MVHSNAANRLDRLPISSFHKYILFALSFAYFFEFGDTNTFAVAAPQLIKLWGISVNTIAYITSISFLGMFIGSITGGWLADKLGRKKAIIWTVIFFSVFSLLNGLAWDALSIGVFRFLTGVGLAALTVVANTYISEIFPGKSRGKYQALAIVIGICGTPVTTWVAKFLIPLASWGWRLVFVWGTLGIIILLFSRKIVESPRWYESRGEYDKANEILKKIEFEVSKEKGKLPEPKIITTQAVKPKKIPVKDLFKGNYLRISLLLTVLWVTQTIGFFGYSSWAPTLLFKQGITVEKSLTYVAVATLGAPLGSYIAALISDRFERKWSLTIAGVTIAISGLLYGLTFNPVFIIIFGLLVNMFERVFTAIAYAYSPELFPTEARAIGSGVPYGIGRLSNLVGPLIISYIFTHNGYQSVFYFIAGTWLVGAIVIAFFGPKTKKRSLEEFNLGGHDNNNQSFAAK
jgi:MFS transporter, putative metabolite:H+ symporter